MDSTPIRFWFDYADPLSYVQDRVLTAVLDEAPETPVERIPLELRPPPAPLIDPEGSWWRNRWTQALAAAAEAGIVMSAPSIVPWTRKAHELVEHARESGLEAAVHGAIFDAFFGKGLDIGRIDVLVELAMDLGLDRTSTKATLDVDRHAATVTSWADVSGAPSEPPVIAVGPTFLRGFHNHDDLRTFLG